METYQKKTKQFLYQGLFDAVSSFKEFEGRIEKLDSNQDKGDAFEVFAQAYLATQKIVQAKSVWTFDNIPEKVKAKIFIDTPRDMGVDGVFEMNTGEQCAYQVKFRSGRPSLTWTELSTFMGLTEQADKRVLFTNCDDIPDLMNDRSDFYCIRGSDLDSLGTDDFNAISAWLSDSEVELKHFTPKPHQKDALKAIKTAFMDADRATVVMACGTGKTLAQLWAAELLNVKSVLVLLPSLALVRQTLHEWLKQTKWENYSYLCVCSDPSVKGGDEVVVKQSELDFPVTTDGAEVARYLNTNTKGPHVVFSTYQSAQVVAEGMPGDFAFDLGFFDEAHKTAGREGTKFAYALSDDNLQISKRLFMTATPRHYNVQKKDKEGDSKLVYSMDVPELYGKTVYNLQFRQAVNDDLICDYKVLISVVTGTEIDDWQLSHGEVIVQGDTIRARQVANQIALKNAVDEYGVHRIFTFHASVASAQSFTSEGGEGINSELPDFVAVHVNGAMPAAKRSNIMREFAEADQAVISNARCLTEGVDVPAVDMVAFLSPKKSKVDIVQATGRAMRKSPGKEVGYVLVPLYLEQHKDESLEEALERTDYSEIWNVLQAMKEQDDDLADVIRETQEERGKTGGYDDSRLMEHLEVIGPALTLATLRNSVITQCIEHLGDNWDLRFGELILYKEEYGDCNVPRAYSENLELGTWVGSQRTFYKQGKLENERINRLETLGFVWDQNDFAWEKWFLELKAYREKHGHCNVPNKFPSNRQLKEWVKTQRRRYKQGKIDSERIRRLEEIGFVWDKLTSLWEEKFNELLAFNKEYGHCNVSYETQSAPQLGQWVANTRTKYKQGKLEADRVKRLEEIGFVWNDLVAVWDGRYLELKAFREKYGHCRVPAGYFENTQLVMWVRYQRNAFKQGKLEADRVRKLEEIGFVWNQNDVIWEEKFNELLAFNKEYGHCNVSYETQSAPQLGKWVANTRTKYKQGKLDADRVKRLEEIGFVWNPNDVIWEEKFNELLAFNKEYGHCNVSYETQSAPQLGNWVANTRTKYKQGKLEADRVKRLEEIGFVWNALVAVWDGRYLELKAFREKYGHCRVPEGYSENTQLASWVAVQRKTFSQGKLEADRVKRLEEIGFVWDFLAAVWDGRYLELKAFREKYGHCSVPRDFSENPKLALWVLRQRRTFSQGKIEADRVRRLEEIGFIWNPSRKDH